MAHGPAPTPKEEKRRRGSWRGTYAPDDLTLKRIAPKPPSRIKGEALAEWRRIVALLEPAGALTGADRMALTILCELWAEDCELGRHLAKRTTVGTDDWKRMHSVRADTRKKLFDLFARFGLTPADRPRVKVPAKERTAADQDSTKPKGKDKGRFIAGRITPEDVA